MYIQTQRIIYLTIDLEKLSAFFRAAAPPSDEVNGLIFREQMKQEYVTLFGS